MRAYVFRFAPKSGHCATDSACPFRANNANIFGLVERFGLAGHERPEILDRGSLGRNRRERSALVLCGVTNGMVGRDGHAFRKALRGANYADRS